MVNESNNSENIVLKHFTNILFLVDVLYIYIHIYITSNVTKILFLIKLISIDKFFV